MNVNAGLSAYHKIIKYLAALETEYSGHFLEVLKASVDDVGRRVAVRHLLQPVTRNFCFEEAAAMDDNELHDVVAKFSENIPLKKKLEDMYNNLNHKPVESPQAEYTGFIFDWR